VNITKIKIALLGFVFVLLSTTQSFSGASFDVPETDTSNEVLIGFFDLRDRETYIQITNVDLDPTGHNVHIQIYDISNDCNENNFFDFYTPNDTHVYNVRDIETNDGNDSGVILPDGAYGIFVAFGSQSPAEQVLIGNLRILDNNGYEYRTNIQGTDPAPDLDDLGEIATFNFNTKGGVILSDIILISTDQDSDEQEERLADVLNVWNTLDVDIYDLNENVFSCRKVISSCINQDSALYEALLEEAADFCDDCGASVADIEYGINEALPHSKGGELLCPGNTISEGIVRLGLIGNGDEADDVSVVYVGLNNGNGRGSMDAFFNQNAEIPTPAPN